MDARRDVRLGTLTGYRYALKPVIDHLGSIPLQHLRTADLDALVTLRMADQPVAQRDKRGRSARAGRDTDLVAVNADGSPIRPETCSKVFAAHCAAAGVPIIRLHDVRHTAATMLLDGGTTPSATAKWLGHDPAITLRVYGHVYDDAQASAGDALMGRSRATGD